MRSVIGLVIVIVAAIIGYGVWHAQELGAQDEPRMIQVVVTRYDAGIDTSESGDACAIHENFPAYSLTPKQVVVTNEADTVIAVADMRGVLEADDFGGFTCRSDLQIPVPEASFYTVYAGAERVITLPAEALPLDEFDVIRLNF